MTIYDIQRKLLTETLAPLVALNLAIVDENGKPNLLKMTNKTESAKKISIRLLM